MLRPLRSTSRRSWLANSLTCGSSSSGKALQRGIASPLFPPVGAGIPRVPPRVVPVLATHRDAPSKDLSSRDGGARERLGPFGMHRCTPTRPRSSVPPATPSAARLDPPTLGPLSNNPVSNPQTCQYIDTGDTHGQPRPSRAHSHHPGATHP